MRSAPLDEGEKEMRLAIRKKKNLPPTAQKEPAHSFTILLPTAETYRHRAEEAKRLAMQSRDVWEREILLRVATQMQLLAAHREVKEGRWADILSPDRDRAG
jgi:hypothetical protein